MVYLISFDTKEIFVDVEFRFVENHSEVKVYFRSLAWGPKVGALHLELVSMFEFASFAKGLSQIPMEIGRSTNVKNLFWVL